MKIIRVYNKPVEKQDWTGFEYTGEIMEVEYENRNGGIQSEGLRVIKGKYTPCGAVRDCGDHYIKANYSSYNRIDKETFAITKDVCDI